MVLQIDGTLTDNTTTVQRELRSDRKELVLEIIDGTLKDINTPIKSGTESDSNEMLLQIDGLQTNTITLV